MARPKIVECVPNFSEGRSGEVIEAIASAIRGTEGCSLLDVDAGASTNRTVYTFVGSPDAAVQGALAAARMAFRHIDMTEAQGWVCERCAHSDCHQLIRMLQPMNITQHTKYRHPRSAGIADILAGGVQHVLHTVPAHPLALQVMYSR